MVILKKVKASTLMETLVASVLIIIIFMIASVILNNIFSNTIKGNTRNVETHLKELEYLYVNEKIILPYDDEFNSWDISIEKGLSRSQQIVEFEAIHSETNKTITKSIFEN